MACHTLLPRAPCHPAALHYLGPSSPHRVRPHRRARAIASNGQVRVAIVRIMIRGRMNRCADQTRAFDCYSRLCPLHSLPMTAAAPSIMYHWQLSLSCITGSFQYHVPLALLPASCAIGFAFAFVFVTLSLSLPWQAIAKTRLRHADMWCYMWRTLRSLARLSSHNVPRMHRPWPGDAARSQGSEMHACLCPLSSCLLPILVCMAHGSRPSCPNILHR